MESTWNRGDVVVRSEMLGLQPAEVARTTPEQFARRVALEVKRLQSDDGWIIELGPNRELTLRLPDGNVHDTDPPGRRTAA